MKLHWEWEFDVSREALWRYVADTDWVNRHAGLPKIQTRVEAQKDGSTKRFAWFGAGPLRVEWEERPTLWKTPEFYEVERRYSSGPLKTFVNRTALVAVSPQRTKIVVDIDMQARSALFAPLLPVVAAQGKAGADRAFKRAADLAASPEAREARKTERRFAVLRERGVDADAIAMLERFVAEGDERDFAEIRPYEVADRYGVSRRSALRAFLMATRAGLFNLRWAVICPSCRGTPNSFETISELGAELHCPSCNLPYGPQFDRSVEVTFNAAPMGLGTNVGLFCIASPQRSEHVIAQTALEPRASAKMELPFAPGAYDVNAVGTGMTPFVADADDATRNIWSTIDVGEVSFPHQIGTGMIELRFENATDRETLVRIEAGRWPDTIATAAQVTSMQEFRDMFSSEVLAPGLELSVESLAVLFTDLVGSTAMYTKAGDAPAFKIVTDHFDRMKAIIGANEGAIIKTIGDAIMAVFIDPANCMRAALQLDRAVRDLMHEGEPLRLRVGFHVGPCIAMRANDRIDYFGTTVNLAARLQSKAGAGEVAVAHRVATRDDVAAVLQRDVRAVSRESVAVKGIGDAVDMLRVAAD